MMMEKDEEKADLGQCKTISPGKMTISEVI